MRSSLATNGVKGVPGRATECVINSLCPVEGKPLDILKYKCECTFEDCNTCSKPKVTFQQILKGAENKDLKRKCSWSCWKTTTKTINSKECSTFERLKVWGMLEELIDQYMRDVLQMHQHLFHLEWQWLQSGELVDNLKEGEVVFVIDFVKNYNHQETEEPQSAHWDCMQSMMHPVVVKYKCQCGKTVTDKIIHFTSDLKHNTYAVEEFERKTIEHLKAKNIMIKCIYKWSDNCPAQYKSRIPFRILSKSNIPIMQNYFCEKHSKSDADSLIGRTSQFLYTAVCTNKADIPDAEALYNFCRENWKEK